MQKIITITVNSEIREIKVTEIPLIKYPDIFNALEELPKHLKDFDKQETSDILEQIPLLLRVATPDVIRILTIIFDGQLLKSEIENFGLSSFIKLTEALFEVNDYQEVYHIAKKALAQLSQKSPEKLEIKTD